MLRGLLNRWNKNKTITQRLFNAAKEGNITSIEVIINSDASIINSRNSDNLTPLMIAAFNGHNTVVKALLAAGANKEARDNNNDTALTFATFNKQTSVVNTLLTAGANIEAHDKNHDTPLTCAAYNGDVEMIKILLAAGANTKAHDKSQHTPLHKAAFYGHKTAVQILLDANANKEAKDYNNNTPLHLAASNGHFEVVQALIAAGANVKAKNNLDNTARVLAKLKGYSNIVTALRDAGDDTFRYRLKSYEGKIPEQFLDPISFDLMNDPITVSSGQTYDRKSLKKFFAFHNNPPTLLCPLTNQLIKREELKSGTSVFVKNVLEEFVKSKEEGAKKKTNLEAEVNVEITTVSSSTQHSISVTSLSKFKERKEKGKLEAKENGSPCPSRLFTPPQIASSSGSENRNVVATLSMSPP